MDGWTRRGSAASRRLRIAQLREVADRRARRARGRVLAVRSALDPETRRGVAAVSVHPQGPFDRHLAAGSSPAVRRVVRLAAREVILRLSSSKARMAANGTHHGGRLRRHPEICDLEAAMDAE